MTLDAYGLSHIGHYRKNQEDAFHVGDGIYAVADGMGGHAGGEIASALAIRAMIRFSDESLQDAIGAAHESIIAAAMVSEGLEGMGTTIVAAKWDPKSKTMNVSHVGDSRAYIFRPGRGLSQLTKDHGSGGYLLQCLGGDIDRGISPSSHSFKPKKGEIMFLCSDGLTGEVGHSALAETLGECHKNKVGARGVAECLVNLCLSTAARDNVTVIAVKF